MTLDDGEENEKMMEEPTQSIRDCMVLIIKEIVKLGQRTEFELKKRILKELSDYLNQGLAIGVEHEILKLLRENKGQVDAYHLPQGLEAANENVLKMINWIEEGGGLTDTLEVRFVSDVYRGVFLRKDVPVNIE